MPSADAVRETVDISTISQLILKERESRDLGRWNDLRDCYHGDADIHVSWFRGDPDGFVAGSIDMARRQVLAKHRLSPIRVVLAGDRAIATMNAIIEIPSTIDGVEMNLLSYVRFVYRAERRDGVWRLYSFTAIYVRDELTPAIPGHSVTIDPGVLQPFRRTYRMLSYVLSRGGYEVDGGLAGEDRPDLVQALMHEVFGWAGLQAA